MNSKNTFKFLYGMILNIGIYIPYCLLFDATIGLAPKAFIFYLSIVNLIIYIWMENKEIKGKYILFITVTVFFLSIFIVYGMSEYLLYGLFSLTQITILMNNNYSYVNRDYFKRSIKLLIYGLLGSSLLYLVVSKATISYLGKFYIIFIFFSIILLRRARGYQYKVKDKEKIKNDILSVGIVLLITNEGIYSLIIDVIGFIYKSIYFILEKGIYLMVYIFSKLYFLIESMLKDVKVNNVDASQEPTEPKKYIEQIELSNPMISFIIRTIILVIIIFVLYKIIKIIIIKYKKVNIVLEEDVIEEREGIKVVKKQSLIDIIKNKFKVKNEDNRIILTFKKVEQQFYKKQIFNKSMTATQLYKVGKNNIESKENLETIVKIYNEAKFSNHIMSEEKIEIVENAYKELKRELS